MRRRSFVIATALALAGCGSEKPTVSDVGELLQVERAASFRDAHSPAREAQFSPDGKWLATASASGSVALRHMPDLKVERRLPHPNGAASLVFAPDGRWIAIAGYDGSVRRWDLASGKELMGLRGASGTVWSLAVSPDGQRISAAGEDKTIRVWDVASGRLIHLLNGHERNVWEVRFSPDGRKLASGSFDATARLWDPVTGKPLVKLSDHAEAVVGLAWSRDGRWLATGGDDSTIKIRRGADGATVRTLSVGNHAYKLTFSPDGKWIANGGRARSGIGTLWYGLTGWGGQGEGVHVWRVADGALVATLPTPDDVMYVAYHPSGKYLATSSEDGTVTIWVLRPAELGVV